MKKNMSKNVKFLLKISISLLLIGVLLKNINIKDVMSYIIYFDKKYILVVIISYTLSLIVNGFKWKILMKEVPFRHLLNLNLIAQFYSLILVGQVSGETAKVLFTKKFGCSIEKTIASVCVDKITGFISVITIGIIGMFFTNNHIESIKIALITILIVLLLSLIILKNSYIYDKINKCLIRFETKSKIVKPLRKTLDSWIMYVEDTKNIYFSIFLGIVFHLIGVTSYYFISLGVGFKLGIAEYCWIHAVLSIALFLPISIAGVGVRDLTFVGFLGYYGVTSSNAMAVSMIIFIINFVVGIIGGIINMYYLVKDKNIKTKLSD
ncbi:lysylphosphatidylglycerol synthase transmembrane domain-containing protein [Clostridium saccharoperbutylacetonicum]